jgi:serine/threonine protein phosphatase PrpC
MTAAPDGNVVRQGDSVHLTVPGVEGSSVRNDRDEQQDALAVTPWLCAVADGMGGHPNGAEASVAALSALCAEIGDHCSAEDLKASCLAADRAVRALAQGGGWRQPGTTSVAVAVGAEHAGLNGVWVGDSRAWLVAPDGEVALLTRDHADTWGALLQCLGEHSGSRLQVDEFAVAAGEGNRVLLTTDGVHGPLGRDTVEVGAALGALLDKGGVGELVAAAAARGSDNATAILIDVDEYVAAALSCAR